MAIETRKSYCRLCTAYCALNIDVENNRVLQVRGDAEDPVSGGYTCIKGRELPYQLHSQERLNHSLKRMPDGRYQPIPTEQAFDEIAEEISRHPLMQWEVESQKELFDFIKLAPENKKSCQYAKSLVLEEGLSNLGIEITE